MTSQNCNLLHQETDPLSLTQLILRGLTNEEKELYTVRHNKQRATKGLFYDFDTSNPLCVYTLHDCRPFHYRVVNDVVRYDMRQLYLGCDDITEFRFIDKFLYDKHQWERLCGSYVFKPHIKSWREEQRLKVKSDMFNILLQDASDVSSKTKTSSAKYLLEKYYDPKTPTNRQSARDKKEDNRLLTEDKKRISEGFLSISGKGLTN